MLILTEDGDAELVRADARPNGDGKHRVDEVRDVHHDGGVEGDGDEYHHRNVKIAPHGDESLIVEPTAALSLSLRAKPHHQSGDELDVRPETAEIRHDERGQ